MERYQAQRIWHSRRIKEILQFITLFLAISLSLTTLVPAAAMDASEQHGNGSLSNFAVVNDYVPGQFSDVDTSSWYSSDVEAAYKYGLMQGSSSTQFNPNGNITIAEAIVLSSRLHSIYYNDGYNFTQGTPWYDTYVQYAIANGIIEDGTFSNYNTIATRAQFATILSAAFPDEALQAINDVTDIPDLDSSLSYAPQIYKLYNAGILTGNDAYGTFTPEASITRSSVAAIVARMALPDQRKYVTLQEKPIAATGVTLNVQQITLEVGDTFQLEPAIIPSNATDKTITWESPSDSISVSSTGLITAKAVTDPIYDGVYVKAITASGAFSMCIVKVVKPTVKINIKNNLPMKLHEYDWRNNIESSWLVNDFRYEVDENYDGTYDVDFYFSGEKTYDARGSGQGATCKISWQLFDEDGYVVDSGTCYSPSVRTGEKFRDASEYLYWLDGGTYTLELSSTN